MFYFFFSWWTNGLFFPLLCLRKWLHHDSQGRWTPSEDWHINLFPLSQTITLKKNKPLTKWLISSSSRTTRWMECHCRECLRRVFRSEEGGNGHVSISEVKSCLRRRAGRLWEPPSRPTVSHRVHRYVFSHGHHRQCLKLLRNLSNATSSSSSSAPKSHPHHPSIFILLLPRLIDFLFSLFSPSSPPVLQLSPSSQTLPTVQPVSLRFFFIFFFNSVFHSLTRSGQSFSSLTRSKPQPCSELLKVRKWRCNVIEWSGNRIHEGWVWSC